MSLFRPFLSKWSRGRRATFAYRPKVGQGRGSFHPSVEVLEDRTLLSVALLGQPHWTDLGPNPMTHAQNVIPSDTANSIASGAIEAVAVDPGPGMAAHVIVGTVNGGIWQTNNINATPVVWSTTTDQLPSLAISDVAFSPADSKTIYAGTGSYTNGGVGTASGSTITSGSSGGAPIGIYRSTDEGNTWTILGTDVFKGMRIRKVVPTALTGGQTVFAATTDSNGPGTGGVYRSDKSGAGWTRLSGANGLPDAGVTDLIADPSNPNRFYAAVPAATGAGIYRLDVTGGNTTWANISGNLPAEALQGIRIKLSASPAGVHPIYAGVINDQAFLQGVYRGVTGAGGVVSWTAVGPGGKPPAVYGNYPNAQGAINFSIVADPHADNLVYVGGDARKPFPFSGNLARGDSTANTWTAVSALGTTPAQPGTVVPADGSAATAPHADSRNLVFSGTNILEADDGGIYRLANPTGVGGVPTWTPADGNLENTELYQAAVDDRNNSNPGDDVFLGAAQDNDASQRDPSGTWQALVSGDGTLVLADSVNGFRYLATQNFYLFRNRNGGALSAPAGTIIGTAPGVTRTLNNATNDTIIEGLPFQPAAALNMANPNRMLVGGNGTLYESLNNADTFRSIGGLDNTDPHDPKPNPVPVGNTTMTGTVQYGAIAYGNLSDPNLAYVGTDNGNIYVTTDITVAGGGFQATDFATAAGGTTPLGIVVDPHNARTAYAVTDTGVFQTTNGMNWKDITANIAQVALSGGVNTLASITLADGVLLVGGYGGVFRFLPARPGAANSWVLYGATVPNVVVSSLQYDARGDTLLAATYGRGAWIVTNASATLTAASVLRITGDNTVDLRRDPNNPLFLDVFENKGSVTGTATKPDAVVKLSSLQQITVATTGASDDLFLDSSYGAFSVPGGISFTATGNQSRLSLNGPSWEATWNITGANAGNIDGLVASFVHVPNLDGSPVRDLFHFAPGGSLAGVIDGHGGGDFLDYSAQTAAVVVNLAAGTASLTGGVHNVQNVLGSASGGDRLTGNAQGNVLVGHGRGNTLTAGSGRSILIGGFGSNTLTGGPADDLLIAGRTAFDASVGALASLLAEWQRGLPYDQRVSHLRNAGSGGLNGDNTLVVNSTVFLSGRRPGQRVGPGGNDLSRLVGGGGRNWFFTISPSTIADLQSGEQVN